MSLNTPPRGKQQVPITQELIQRVAAYITQGGGMALYPAQNDTFAFPDDCDATHPWNCDFPLPSNYQNMLSARLTWKLRPYRTFNTFSTSTTQGQSNNHIHDMTHTHNHKHNLVIANGTGGTTVSIISSALADAGGGHTDTSTVANDATASSAANTGVASADHTHGIVGSSFLGITEDTPPVNPGITLTVDGTDVTTATGGPFNNDVIELDIRAYVGKAAGALHLVSLQPNQRCRVHGILKLSYTVSPGLA